jgi:hypothetical protein
MDSVHQLISGKMGTVKTKEAGSCTIWRIHTYRCCQENIQSVSMCPQMSIGWYVD